MKNFDSKLWTTFSSSNDTPNLSQAIGCGQVQSVQTWLELQKLGNYKEQFEKCGIDSLEKVSNMTLR